MEKHKGRYLGDKLTEELLTAIREYDTSKIDTGDYFVINGIKFYVNGWNIPRAQNVSEEHHITTVTENSRPIPITCEKFEDGDYGYYSPSISWFCNPINPYSTWFWSKM
jgi:hypothetical protein